jgi:hypothetical protein
MIFKTTAIYENRIRDKKELFAEILFTEEGDSQTLFLTSKDNLLCTGYERIVFGDHGPYIEFSIYQVNFDNWFSERLGLGYYDKFYPRDESRILMYAQRKTVEKLPNPPKGKRSFRGNRKEGYADYKVGMFYISPWEKNLKIIKNGIVLNNQRSSLSDILGG